MPAGFVSSLPLSRPRSASLFADARTRWQSPVVLSRRCNLSMCAAQEDSEEELTVQGPTQAPTKAGISTVGLSESEAAFFEACYLPDIEKIEGMLDGGIDPNITDINGRTALHFCAGNGIPTICRKLLDLGADINKQDLMGFTPLAMATGYKMVDTVRLLVDVGADANIASFKGQLPVEIAEDMLEKTPQKKFFVKNGDFAKLKEIVEVLDDATEEEDEWEEDEDEFDENGEMTEETESAKFVVRVKPKGDAAPAPPTVKVDDVKVTIRVKEPEPKK